MNIIFVGCRGYSVNYGGWETFLHNLINNWKDPSFHFYVFEIVDSKEKEVDEVIDGVTCIRIYIKTKSHGKMILFALKCFQRLKAKCKQYKIDKGYLYIMGAAIGMLHFFFKKKLRKMNLITIHNPAGLEWKRDKWNWFVKKYIFLSHYFLSKNVDYLICDSKAIADVYRKMFKKKNNIHYISYGTYQIGSERTKRNSQSDAFLERFSLSYQDYYLVLGRFVPENNYEIIVSQFLESTTTKKLLIISNHEDEIDFFKYLKKKYSLDKQNRIIFAGKVYNKDILEPVRKGAVAYIHGHSVGGTNPGLLEAMSISDVNILFDCPFNREVGQDAAFYFDANSMKLSNLFESVEAMSRSEREKMGQKAKLRMTNDYSWDSIVNQYCLFFKEHI